MSSSTNSTASVIVPHTDLNITQHIPTLVNGEVSEPSSNKVEQSNSNVSNMLNLINELKTELTNQRNSYSVNKKHKIVCIGDSHTRGFSKTLSNLMGNNFDYYGVVMPGSNSNQILETAHQEINNLSSDDILVICSGTNDLTTNNSTLAFQNMLKMVSSNNHTHIVLINIPHRYDTINSNTTNHDIGKFNKKLLKLTKVFPHASFLQTDQNRQLFTKHGLHYNKFGKYILLHQLALMIYSLFVQKNTCVISLDWYKPETSEDKLLNRASTRNRKQPVTRSTDFLW